MGTIGKVLPYINGFVMALKEIVKALAFIVGYEEPNSSGVDRNIFDSMGTGIEDVNSGLDSTNDKLDSAKKKTKEWKNFLASFDVANVIPDQTDSDTSGSGDSGGVGSGYIDPRILAALKDYDNLMDSVNMKAKEIRDTLLEAAEKLGVLIDDHIFQPISRSWDKYGASVIKNAQISFSNLGYILSDALSIVAKKWDPFFQNLSDLFFSLIDTATLLGSTISKFFKIAWDSGGRVLFEGVWDLVTAFLELATAINDDFIKPIIKALNQTLVPIFGSAVGAILGLLGNFLKAIANIISAIAKCKPLVITLASAFTALFITIKVAKFVELYSTLKNILGPFGALKSILLQNSTLFSKLWITIGKGKGIITTVKDSYTVLNSALANTKVWSIVSSALNGVGDKLLNLSSNMLEASGKASSLGASLIGKLGSALSFLAANPIVAVVAGLTALIAVIAGVASSQKEAKYEMDDYSESIQKQIETADELSKSLDEAKNSAKQQEADRLAELETVEIHLKKLQELAGESGYVDNIALAQEHINAINKELPDTVKLTEGGRVEWSKMPNEIYKTIDALKEKAKVEALSQLYTESIKNQIKAENELATLVEKQNELYSKKADLEKKLSEGSYKQRAEAAEQYKQLNADIDGNTKAMEKYKGIIEDTGKSIENYENQISSLSETTGESTKKLELSYEGLSDAGNKAFNDLGNQMRNVSKQHEEYIKEGMTLNDEELQNTQETKNAIIEKYAEQAAKYGQSYEDMLEILKKQNVKLTKEEKKHLEDSIKEQTNNYKKKSDSFTKNCESVYKTLQDYGVKMDAETKKQYSNLLTLLKNHGVNINSNNSYYYSLMLQTAEQYGINLNSEMGDIYANVLSMFNRYGADMNNANTIQHAGRLTSMINFGSEEGKAFVKWLKNGAKSDDISPEVRNILDKAQITIDGKKPKINFNTESSSSVNRKINNVLPHGASVDVAINFISGTISSAVKNVIGIMNNGKKYRGYATGGFPNVGEMFIAREKGPELVGTMGSRNAVANNYQIENGIYRAVKAALGGVRQGGDLHITIQNEDGTKIEKIIRNYNDYIERNGGKGGFTV